MLNVVYEIGDEDSSTIKSSYKGDGVVIEQNDDVVLVLLEHLNDFIIALQCLRDRAQ